MAKKPGACPPIMPSRAVRNPRTVAASRTAAVNAWRVVSSSGSP